jgi:hypothetical protein
VLKTDITHRSVASFVALVVLCCRCLMAAASMRQHPTCFRTSKEVGVTLSHPLAVHAKHQAPTLLRFFCTPRPTYLLHALSSCAHAAHFQPCTRCRLALYLLYCTGFPLFSVRKFLSVRKRPTTLAY